MDELQPTTRHGSEKRQRNLEPKMRCTPGEHAQLVSAAERAGLTVAAFMRHQCLGTPGPRAARRPPVERLALAKLLAQLGKVGSNLNQIARVLNSGGDTPAGIEETLQEVRAAAVGIREMLGVRTL
jgi:hypothetical protein